MGSNQRQDFSSENGIVNTHSGDKHGPASGIVAEGPVKQGFDHFPAINVQFHMASGALNFFIEPIFSQLSRTPSAGVYPKPGRSFRRKDNS
jgi:hypothetical protein